MTGEMALRYSSSLIQQRWDDVLGILNADHNGGYTFSSYQWLRNGQPVAEAVLPYLYVPEKLRAGDEYAVMLYVEGDERGIPTCSYVIPATPVSAPAMQPQKRVENGRLVIRVGEHTYTAQGNRMD